jgi:hypothetical protein
VYLVRSSDNFAHSGFCCWISGKNAFVALNGRFVALGFEMRLLKKMVFDSDWNLKSRNNCQFPHIESFQLSPFCRENFIQMMILYRRILDDFCP